MKRITVLVLSFLIFGVTYFLTPFPAAAQSNTNYVDTGYPQALKDARTSGKLNSEAYSNKFTQSTILSWIEFLAGSVPGLTAVADDSVYNQKITARSAIGGTTNLIASIFTNPPASTYAFMQDMGQSIGILPKTAHAQGIGFSGLAPLLPLWKAFRNIAYLLVAIIMVVIGFMVMFRKKIDPKTVVTVQNALPRIVITILLITFSYAIVGLTIDIMYLLINVSFHIFSSSGYLPDLTASDVMNNGIFTNVYSIPESELPLRILFGIKAPSSSATTFIAGASLASIALTFLTVPIGAVILILGSSSLVLTFIISIALFILVIRLFLFFLGAYVKIITSLIFSPFQLLMNAMPGSNSFANWYKELISNIIVFPIGAIMFMLSGVFIQISDTAANLWHPPFTGFLATNATSMGALLALGVLFSIPNVCGSIKEALKAKPFMEAGLGSVTGVLGQPMGVLMQLGQFAFSARNMQLMREQVKNTAGIKPPAGKKER